MPKKNEPPPLESREFRSPEEIDAAIRKIQRRIAELEQLDVKTAVIHRKADIEVAESNVSETVREVFGDNSTEYREHRAFNIWEGSMHVNMSNPELIQRREAGRLNGIGILKGLIVRLNEKREDMQGGGVAAPSTYFDRLNLHPRILTVARERFMGGQPWDAVFAASKAVINFVKERSDRYDLDGTPLVRTVFSKNDPILAFNELSNPTELDEQEGIMHLFEGAVLAIRNPGGHSFPEGSDQRAIEYLSLISMLAYLTQEAKKRR